MVKYIFVTGGVISGLGKGVTAASIGAILQMLGEKRITIKKLDPYLNVDPGTMNPLEHGEVYVTNDGCETDLDLGYYERFLEMEMGRDNSTSSGKLYKDLLEKERKGGYLGKTVQMVPHFTDIVKDFISFNESEYDYIICEIGGSTGDIEAMAFYEGIRQLKTTIGAENILLIHLTYLIYYSTTKELKTKPTQNAVRDLQRNGLFPDILVCRTEIPITKAVREKLSLHSSLPKENIIEAIDVESIYNVPLHFIKENIHHIIKKKFTISGESIDTKKWDILNKDIKMLEKTITIGILGKYVELNDSYKSLIEALFHSGLYYKYKVNIKWINAREDKKNSYQGISGIIIPGGFGINGIEMMVKEIEQIRKNNIPTLGICLGMQLMVIEYFRNVVGEKDAGSAEFPGYSPNVVSKLRDKNEKGIGGTMRLGGIQINLKENSKVRGIYKEDSITERHRHRYTINTTYSSQLEENGFKISGYSERDNRIEIVELDEGKHPWYIGCQYHPEYKSTPFRPHPLFLSYIEKCLNKKI